MIALSMTNANEPGIILYSPLFDCLDPTDLHPMPELPLKCATTKLLDIIMTHKTEAPFTWPEYNANHLV